MILPSNSYSTVSEEVKSAASYALGSICIGNLQQYLPFILKESQEQPKRQYLLLHAVKEVRTMFDIEYMLKIMPKYKIANWLFLSRFTLENKSNEYIFY